MILSKKIKYKLIKNLWYCKCNKNRNVGDLVGMYVYEKITGKKIRYIHPCKTKEKVYLTCGSILQHRHVKNNNTIIWGSGLMYDNIKEFKAEIFALRGKKTKNVLEKIGLNCPDVLGDIALLLPRFYNPKNIKKEYEVGLIFHFTHNDNEIINVLKQKYKLNIINVNLPIEKFIDEIVKCERTISSSLHGVIISHSYNVKSLPIHLDKNGLNNSFFKFEDYYSCFDLEMKKIFKNEIINTENIISLIDNYNQPKFPINTEKLYNSCPFL